MLTKGKFGELKGSLAGFEITFSGTFTTTNYVSDRRSLNSKNGTITSQGFLS